MVVNTPQEISLTSLPDFIAIGERKELPVCLSDPENPAFKPLHQTLENRFREHARFRELHAEGVGTTRRQAEIVAREEEELLWSSGAMGVDSPSACSILL